MRTATGPLFVFSLSRLRERRFALLNDIESFSRAHGERAARSTGVLARSGFWFSAAARRRKLQSRFRFLFLCKANYAKESTPPDLRCCYATVPFGARHDGRDRNTPQGRKDERSGG